MTNTQKMTGALAFLGSIAVLDNFIFVEADPDFEEMVLIATDAAQTQGDDATSLDPFWIDTHEVRNANFAKFVASTGYQSKSAAGNDEWSLADPQEPTAGARQYSQSAAIGDSFAQVSYEDALAYCNWLGKDLPSDLQVSIAASAHRAGEIISAKLPSLHHVRTLSKTWIDGIHEQEFVINAASDTEERRHSPGNTDGTAFLGFLCVRNVAGVQY